MEKFEKKKLKNMYHGPLLASLPPYIERKKIFFDFFFSPLLLPATLHYHFLGKKVINFIIN